MINYESCVDEALYQLGLGEDFDERDEPNKVTNRGDDPEIRIIGVRVKFPIFTLIIL